MKNYCKHLAVSLLGVVLAAAVGCPAQFQKASVSPEESSVDTSADMSAPEKEEAK